VSNEERGYEGPTIQGQQGRQRGTHIKERKKRKHESSRIVATQITDGKLAFIRSEEESNSL
jgi:hypothetical protein